MEEEVLSVIIMTIGAILMITEALSPGTFLAIPGTTLVVVGAMGYVIPGFLYSIQSPITAAVLAIPSTFITIKLYQKLAEPVPPATTTVVESLIGKRGKVTVATNPNSLKGKVAIGTDVWSADSDEFIEVGTDVIVVSARGVHITVKKE